MITKMSPQAEALQTMLYSLREETGGLKAFRHKHLNIQGLLDAGLLVPGPYATAIFCNSCCNFGEVFWSEHPKTGAKRVVYRCPCGVNPVNPEELLTWPVAVPTLTKRISEAMKFTSPPKEAIPSRVWSFGRKMRREFYFITCVTNQDRNSLQGLFVPQPTAVLLAATEAVQHALTEWVPNHLAFNLETITTLDDSCRLAVDMTEIDAALVPSEVEPKRQRAKRGNRAANIEDLISEMREHYRASKDHYYAQDGHQNLSGVH